MKPRKIAQDLDRTIQDRILTKSRTPPIIIIPLSLIDTMILRYASQLNSPALVATAGATILLGLPALEAAAASSVFSLAFLKGANILAFIVNAAAVSVPGRIDGIKDEEMRQGVLNPSDPEDDTAESQLVDAPFFSAAGTRTLVMPSGWAFAIWAPIYLGEAVFCTAQLFASESSALAGILPQVTASFVAANLIQSLWCASFRPSYSQGWKKYVSVGMLAGTAYSLSHVHAVGISPEAASLGWYFLPLTMHFGWTTAATLVNLNGSIAEEETSDSTVIAVGHASAILATTLGVGITLAQSSPVYGLTVAWALNACAFEAAKKAGGSQEEVSAYQKGARVQKALCWVGTAACVTASLFQTLS
jgi:hypothetical protein